MANWPTFRRVLIRIFRKSMYANLMLTANFSQFKLVGIYHDLNEILRSLKYRCFL